MKEEEDLKKRLDETPNRNEENKKIWDSRILVVFKRILDDINVECKDAQDLWEQIVCILENPKK